MHMHLAGAAATVQPHSSSATASASRADSNELPSLSGPALKVKTGNLIGQIGLKAGRNDIAGHQLVTVPVGGAGQAHNQGQRQSYARWH